MTDAGPAIESRWMRSGFFDSDAFLSKRRSILVLQTGIAGIRHRVDLQSEKGKALLASLTPGTELRLYREPENEHDEWAVAVYTTEEEHIGYITRFKNETIARLMDSGKAFHACVDKASDKERPAAPTEDDILPIAVYMDD